MTKLITVPTNDAVNVEDVVNSPRQMPRGREVWMRRIAIVMTAQAAMVAFGPSPVNGQALEFCTQINRLNDAGQIATYSNTQIQNGLCMTSREMALARASGNRAVERACNLATVAMFREFRLRFRDRDISEVLGRC